MSSKPREKDIQRPFPVEKVPYEGLYSRLKRTHKAFLIPHDKLATNSSSSTQDIQKEVSELMTQVYILVKIKDLLHFILSYPVKLLPDESDYSMLHRSISMLERRLEELLTEGSRTSPSIPHLPISLSGTYIPVRWRHLLLYASRRTPSDYGILERIPDWAISSATRQASQCILEENVRLIAISGQEAGVVVKALKDMPEIQSMFDIVLHVPVSEHQSIEELLQGASTSLLSLQEADVLLMLEYVGKCIVDQKSLRDLMDRDYACVVLATPSDDIYQTIVFDLGIRMENHLLPLELFYKYSELQYHEREDLSSDLSEVALNSLELCHGDLLVIIILAKELQRECDVAAWRAALDELKSLCKCHEENGVSDLLSLVLTFIWKQKDKITKLCIQRLATYNNEEELTTTSMVSSLLEDGLVQTEEEGKYIIDGLVKSNLLEDNTRFIIMREEIKDVFLKYVIPPLPARTISDDPEIIDLKNGQVTELPDSPNCPHLVLLCLQNNRDLLMVPPLYFKHMPLLSTLNLSNTSIKTLPASISALVSLKRLFLRGCELFLELPPEIGHLSDLEVIDLEGTRVMYLPDEIARLQKLRSLKLSFYACGGCRQGSKQRISEGIFSNLKNLKEIWIDLNPDEDVDEWIADVKNILLSLPSYHRFDNIMLYVPETSLLEKIPNLWACNYKLTVGRFGQRMISRIPREVEEMFKQQNRYLQYTNGESIPTMIKDILRFSNAFILDRHWTAKSLSEFTTYVAAKLELCLLVECNELQTIFNKDDGNFQQLKYLGIYYMRNLRSICSGYTSLHWLKYLSLCTCTSLSSIFTISFLNNLPMLEELVVEDCPKMKCLVTEDSACWKRRSSDFLPSLKKMSLRELPELVGISNGLKIAPKLEKLVIFYCPKLESISEVVGENLKVVKGETEWWDSLSWNETDPLASIFVPLKRDEDLMAQFTED